MGSLPLHLNVVIKYLEDTSRNGGEPSPNLSHFTLARRLRRLQGAFMNDVCKIVRSPPPNHSSYVKF